MIYGLESDALPEGCVPLEAFAVVKCLDGEGNVTIIQRSTENVPVWDAIGWLTMALDSERNRAQECFIPDAQSEDDDELA